MTRILPWHGSDIETQAIEKAGYSLQPATVSKMPTCYTEEPPFLVARKIFEAGANVMLAHVTGDVSHTVLVGVADNLFRAR